MEGSTRCRVLMLSPTTTCSWQIRWTSTLIWVVISGSISSDGQDWCDNTLTYRIHEPSSTDPLLSVWGKGRAEWLHRCLALLSDVKLRNIAGETACSDLLIEVIASSLGPPSAPRFPCIPGSVTWRILEDLTLPLLAFWPAR